jgi:hypothetical protein
MASADVTALLREATARGEAGAADVPAAFEGGGGRG